jgi:T4-like virus tail tube protein gp19
MTMLQTKAAEPDLPSSRILPAQGFGEWLFLPFCDLDIPCALTASVGIGVWVAGSSRAAATLPGEQEEKAMVQLAVNPNRHDPYKQFNFRVRMEGRIVAGVAKVGALRRSTEVIEHREGGDPSTSRKSPAQLILQNEGWERDLSVAEPKEPSF